MKKIELKLVQLCKNELSGMMKNALWGGKLCSSCGCDCNCVCACSSSEASTTFSKDVPPTTVDGMYPDTHSVFSIHMDSY